MGWLDAARGGAVDLEALEALGAEVEAAGYTHALLLGMGGSSLGPEVLSQTFGARPGFPRLLVLDSTNPAQIARIEAQIDPASTLYLVASKSGSSLEPDILHRYFFQQAERALGPGNAGARFIAITDPGSKLETLALRDGFLAHAVLGRSPRSAVAIRYCPTSAWSRRPSSGSMSQRSSRPSPPWCARAGPARHLQPTPASCWARRSVRPPAPGGTSLTLTASGPHRRDRRLARAADRRKHRQARAMASSARRRDR